MKIKMKNLFTALLLLVACMAAKEVTAQQQKKKIKEPAAIMVTGAADREYWSNLLYKISAPVILNLAQSTLKKNMPVEKAPGYALKAERVTYLEAVGRTMAGVAPWLALPDDDTKEGRQRKKLREALL